MAPAYCFESRSSRLQVLAWSTPAARVRRPPSLGTSNWEPLRCPRVLQGVRDWGESFFELHELKTHRCEPLNEDYLLDACGEQARRKAVDLR